MKDTFNGQSGATLFVQDGSNHYHQASDEEILNAALCTINARFSPGTPVSSPTQAHDLIKLHLAPYPHEVFGVLWLTCRHTVIAFEELFRGTLNGASVHPREVLKSALRHNAGACILCHNHPSGQVEPSEADHRITQKLKEALSLVDIRTLDHLIVGEQVFSFSERGFL